MQHRVDLLGAVAPGSPSDSVYQPRERVLIVLLERVVVGQGQQIAHRHRLDVGGAEDEARGELPLREVPLEGEFGDLHRQPRTMTPQAIRPPELPAGSVR